MELDPNMLQAIEAFGREAIKLFYDKGVELKLFNGAEHDIIMDALNQEAEKKTIEKIQEHFDEHFEAKEDCPDIDQLKETFDLEVDTHGKVTVVGYKGKVNKEMN